MKLAKALKLKNKLAGEVARLTELIRDANVTEGNNAPKYDVLAMYEKMIDVQEQLARLKSKIAVANAPIWDKIFRMAELKSRIAVLKTLPTKDGEFAERTYGTQTATPRMYRSAIKASTVEQYLATMTESLDLLQDDVDAHNATTSIPD